MSASSLQIQKQQQQRPYSSYRYPYVYQSPSYPYSSQQQQLQIQLPIANSGVSQTVYENTKVVLDGTRSYDPNPGGTIVEYQWIQLPTRGGVPVNLIGSNTATPYFIAPKLVDDNIVLSFGLRVMDNHGLVSTNPAVMYVMVKHNPNPNLATSTLSNGATTIIPPAQHQQQQQQPYQPAFPNTPNIVYPPMRS
jgi:hypothetical protein